MIGRPISDYALLSDRHSAALVARDGCIDWLCFPRFDSRSVFGALLDPKAGHWSIQPAGAFTSERRYLPGSLALETTFQTAEGKLALRDAMVLGTSNHVRPSTLTPLGEDLNHHLGRDAPHALVRLVECAAGEVEVELDFEPRAEYGLTTPIVIRMNGGARTLGGPDDLLLSSPDVDLECGDGFARGRRRLRSGQRMLFALHWQPEMRRGVRTWTGVQIQGALDETVAAWQKWDELHRGYDGPYAEQVRFSGRVLDALGYEPTGAIVAAATTSLPEVVGGARNWDYRYAWVRDASLTLQATWVAACPRDASRFFNWMVKAAGAVAKGGTPIQIMYGVAGERDLTERELRHLAGWRNSRPVRIGNAAWTQTQLDMYGELLNSAWMLREVAGPYNGLVGHLLTSLAEDAAEKWRLPDNGIWEMRGEPRHFVVSKVMCWVALDRAIRLADQLESSPEQLERWRAEAKAI
ncbi:MAG: glycoside hydrolase family 15 protein, partial [Chloroflexota bacterium]|nr:glycoside hydrolase family 15 protein [Chloroflexota bacterium]